MSAPDADEPRRGTSGEPPRRGPAGEVDLRPADNLGAPDDAATLIASLARDPGAAAPARPATPPRTPPPPPPGQPPSAPPPGPPPTPAAGNPAQDRPAPWLPDARPYPVEPEREPLTLVAIGAGIGLGLLILAGLITLGLRTFGGQDPGSATSASTATPTPIAQSGISVTASSTQESEGGITYSAENTLDGRPETAWNSDGRKDGKGPGMTLTYGFGDPVDLYSITVLNGYQKSVTSSGKNQDLYALNSRIRLMRVVTDTATFTWELADDPTAQTLTSAFGRTSSVRFEVLSVYPGEKYLDLGLSEVSFTARG